jgi:uncharacterized protein YjbI with pentapeptide repeats
MSLAEPSLQDGEKPIARCESQGCDAARLEDQSCIAHVSEAQLEKALRRWAKGDDFDARWAIIDETLLAKFLETLHDQHRESLLATVDPDRPGGSVCGEVHFDHARFTGHANFSEEVFFGATFFDHAVFRGPVTFEGAHFTQHADFDGAKFCQTANFKNVIFDDHLGLEGAQFDSAPTFGSTKFRSTVDLENTLFAKGASMWGCTFQLARQLGPFVAKEAFFLDECLFSQRITVEAVTDCLSARGAIFSDGVRISVRNAQIELSYADFGRSSTLSKASSWTLPAKSTWREELKAEPAAQPMLLTLQGAQVAELSISDIDLRVARFYRAHGLESLIVESSCEWPHPPPLGPYIKRDVIAEECIWREGQRTAWRPKCLSWLPKGLPRPEGEIDEQPLKPEQLAAIYRALRKAGEDSKDQAGTGDLYYGEMEMRRRAALPEGRGRIRAFCDRWIIIVYWALSGYGLKASRAFGAWLVLVALAALAFKRWGFETPVSFGAAVRYGVESCSSLIREAHEPAPLTGIGHTIEFALRITGPILIGLLLLALRSRVKR